MISLGTILILTSLSLAFLLIAERGAHAKTKKKLDRLKGSIAIVNSKSKKEIEELL